MFRAGLPHEQTRDLDHRQASAGRPATGVPQVHDLSPDRWDESVFRKFLQRNELWRRKQLYEQLYAMLQQNSVSASWLQHFIRWEPNFRLVQRATRDYVYHRSCNVLEEFRGVQEIITLYEQQMLTSPGAVLAGLLSIGDRRINAVVRVFRVDLSLPDVREFTRIHEPQLSAPTIEFYLNWMHELTAKKDAKKFDLVCSKLHQMVLHDESGQVSDADETSRVGFRGPFKTLLVPFEDYLLRVEGVLLSSHSHAEFSKVYQPMLNAWRSHAQRASELRSDSGFHMPLRSGEAILNGASIA
jgi:hypothetical protein